MFLEKKDYPLFFLCLWGSSRFFFCFFFIFLALCNCLCCSRPAAFSFLLLPAMFWPPLNSCIACMRTYILKKVAILCGCSRAKPVVQAQKSQLAKCVQWLMADVFNVRGNGQGEAWRWEVAPLLFATSVPSEVWFAVKLIRDCCANSALCKKESCTNQSKGVEIVNVGKRDA